MPRIFNHKTGKFEELNAKNKPAAAQHESVLKLAESVLFLKGDPGTGITELSQPTSDIMRIALSDGTVSDIALLQGVPGATGTGIATVSQPTPGTLEITLTDGRAKIVNLPPGLPGEPGAPGRPGEPGAAGREIELRVDSGMIQTRYAGEENWRDLLRMPRAGRGGGGAHYLRDLGDVRQINPQAGDVLLWSDAEKKWVNSRIGAVTVGVSDGAFRVDDYGGDPKLAIEAALAVSTSIDILPGTYTWTSHIDIVTVEAMDIHCRPGVIFVVAHSGPIGVADVVTLGNFNFKGATFQINNWVASQKVVNIAPPVSAFQTLNCQFTGTFIFGTGVEDDFAPTFAPGNEMIGILITQGASCTIEYDICYPNKGVVHGRFKDGFGNAAKRNKTQNGSIFYFPAIADGQRRPCYIGIDFVNETAPAHEENIYQNLGLIDAITGRTDRRLTHTVRMQIPNVAKGTYEWGHEVIHNNIHRDCLTHDTCVVDIRGPRWLMMSDDYFCFNGTAAALGSGFLRITDANADGTGTNAYAYQSQVVGCHFHNPGTNDAGAIYINSARNLAIQSCVFHELYCAAPIVVDPKTSSDNVNALTIQGCKASWPTSAPNTRHFIKRTGTDVDACKKLYLDGNICESSDASYPITGFYTGTRFSVVHEVQETPLSKSPIEVVRNKTYVIEEKMTYPGRITETTTKCLSGTCTATFYINGVALGGAANSVSGSRQSQAHTSANEFVAGDTISMTITSNAACLDLAYTVTVVRGLI